LTKCFLEAIEAAYASEILVSLGKLLFQLQNQRRLGRKLELA